MTPAAPVASWMFLLLLGLALLMTMSMGIIQARARYRRNAEGSLTGPKGTGHPGSPGDSWARASVCIAIGAVVPSVAFTFTWLASKNSGVDDEIWMVPMMVTMVCVVTTGFLAGVLFRSGRPAHSGHKVADASKPPLDEDAFDVVSRRG